MALFFKQNKMLEAKLILRFRTLFDEDGKYFIFSERQKQKQTV